MGDEDKFGVCGIIWLIILFLCVGLFAKLGFPMWLGITLALAISITISMLIYCKWTK